MTNGTFNLYWGDTHDNVFQMPAWPISMAENMARAGLKNCCRIRDSIRMAGPRFRFDPDTPETCLQPEHAVASAIQQCLPEAV